MSLDNLLATIDAEIKRLNDARAILSGVSAKRATSPVPQKRSRRRMSAAARKRIADAQRKRWAAQKKAAAKNA